MSQIVVDTDVASYLFNWHSSAQSYVNILRGAELILSFMSIAELRMGAILAGWVNHGAYCWSDSCRGSNWFMRTTRCVRFGRGFARRPGPKDALKVRRTAGLQRPHWRSMRRWRPTIGVITNLFAASAY